MKKKRGRIGCLMVIIIAVVILLALAFAALWFIDFDDDYYDDDYDYDDSYEYYGSHGGNGFFGYDDDEYENSFGFSSYNHGNNSSSATYSSGASNISTGSTGDKSATIMIYMIGSDLESDDGSATTDIQEMCYANLGDNVNVVLQTGGTKNWQNNFASDKRVERFVLKDGEPVLMQDLGKLSMVKSSTVTDFIKWSVDSYPADRYGIVFWDHGGGTMMGFGSDEVFPNEILTLNDINTALKNAGKHFDFVGFDACLMGTVETAFAMADYADYLIASEETEPGGGWYYANWLSTLGKNPDVNTEKLAKEIIDDYVKYSNFFDDTTLTLINLDNIDEVYVALANYLTKSSTLLSSRDYSRISGARSSAKSFGDDEFEQIDIISYLNNAGDIDGTDELRAALDDAIVYVNGSVYDANGLAMYYPYSQLDEYSNVMYMLSKMGYNNNGYVSYFNSFVNDLAYGQNYGGRTRSISAAEQLTGYVAEENKPDYSNEDWYDSSSANVDLTGMLTTDGVLELKEKNGRYVLELTDEQWDAIGYVEMSLYIDDGEGYLDFGTDTAVEFTDDGDLSTDFDFLWVTLDDEQAVPFIMIEEKTNPDGKWHSLGYVPATLNNNRDIEILCYWDDDNPEGVIKGYRYASNGDSSSVSLPQRNLLQLKQGDKLDFYCDYYTYEGEYDDSYYVGDTVTVGKNGLSLGYIELADEETVLISFRLVDLYRNEYWTEAIELVH